LLLLCEFLAAISSRPGSCVQGGVLGFSHGEVQKFNSTLQDFLQKKEQFERCLHVTAYLPAIINREGILLYAI